MKREITLLFYLNAILIGLVGALLYFFVVDKKNELNDTAQSDSIIIPSKAQEEPSSSLNLGSGPFSYANAVNKASNAVVSIYTAKTVLKKQSTGNPFFDRLYGDTLTKPEVETGSGSGVIVNDAGYIITNYHVIDGAEQMRVLLKDGRDYPASVIGNDPETDLAVLRIIAENIEPISISTMETIAIGDVALAIGNPFGVGQTVTMGIISATGRDRVGLNTFENFIQTDAAINPGNSGGALINARGDLVGINTAIFSRSGGSNGIGFAIPSNMVKDVLDQILENGQVQRGWLGVEAVNISSVMKEKLASNGIEVTGIYREGPADSAGLIPGDIITHINGIEILSIHDVLKIVTPNKPGNTVAINGIRQGSKFETSALLAQRPLEN